MLGSIAYVPVLRTKNAEINAFGNISEEAKSRTLPLFLARPMPNANYFELTTRKLTEATDGFPFGLGLDFDRRAHASSKTAQTEFAALFSPHQGFRAYFDWVDSVEHAIPVLMPSQDSNNILLQLGNADKINRGLIVHITRDRFIPVLNIAGNTPPLPDDTIFVVDAGWSRNYELLESWAIPMVARIASALPNVEIVTAASSFPDSFSGIIGHQLVGSHERRLFLAARRQFNQTNLTYGDWGSTRPAQSGGGGEIPARIDLPTEGGWNIFRADVDLGQGYGDVAIATSQHAAFAYVPDCYGKQMISYTPGEGGITGPAKSTEARINMHLTIHSDAKRTLDTDDTEYND